jgi:plasmid stabilization system protein ParE
VAGKRRFSVHPQARAELKQAARRYEEQTEGAGERLVILVRAALKTIAAAPERWPDRGGHRQLPLSRYPYAVVYTVSDDEVKVMAIAHGKRKPRYWTKRR